MAHPKRKISYTRKKKRNTHYKIERPYLATCSTTGRLHKPHRAFWKDGKLYYRGRVVVDQSEAKAS